MHNELTWTAFECMSGHSRIGLHEELRMKRDLANGNPQMGCSRGMGRIGGKLK